MAIVSPFWYSSVRYCISASCFFVINVFLLLLNLGNVKFNKRASQCLDAVPDQLMFTNPLFRNKGFEKDSDLTNAECRELEDLDCRI